MAGEEGVRESLGSNSMKAGNAKLMHEEIKGETMVTLNLVSGERK